MTTGVTERINITPGTITDIVESSARTETLVLRNAQGQTTELPPRVRELLDAVLSALVEHETVTIGHLPAELTSTAAAEMLGVSRPTLIKWARRGGIPSFHVGTHTRFRRDDLLTFIRNRERQRAEAFQRLRAFDMEHPEFLDDGAI